MGEKDDVSRVIPNADSKFMQQSLNHLYPRHTAPTVFLSLLVIGTIFVAVGIAVVLASDNVFERDERYDDINSYKFGSKTDFSFAFNGSTVKQGAITRKVFRLDRKVAAPVYLYYRIVGFHQNYRQYLDSRDDSQLDGSETDEVIENCLPFRYPGEYLGGDDKTISVNGEAHKYKSMIYSPCGSIPWSMYNDTLRLYKVGNAVVINSTSTDLPSGVSPVCIGDAFDTTGQSLNSSNKCTKKGIALDMDRETRFVEPSSSNRVWSGKGHPSDDPFLSSGYYADEPGHKIPSTTDEDFMVWARPAALPDFRKLYRVIQSDLEAGDYLLDVQEFFDTSSFSGEKHLVLTTSSWIGARNYVLGIMLIVVGCIGFVFAFAVMLLFAKRGKSAHTNLS